MRIIEKHKTFIETEFVFGTIFEAITEGIEISKKYKLPVLFVFNGINVKCDRRKTKDDILSEVRMIQHSNSIDYTNSKEHFLNQEKYNVKNKLEQDTLDNNLKDYYNLDFSNIKDVLLWFKDNLYYMDNCNILFNKDEVLAPLLKAGYYQNMRTNEEFDSSFKSKELWIIGQIMSCFHPILVDKIKNLYEMKD